MRQVYAGCEGSEQSVLQHSITVLKPCCLFALFQTEIKSLLLIKKHRYNQNSSNKRKTLIKDFRAINPRKCDI